MPAFRVTDMTCDSCIRSLTVAVQDVDAAATLQADLQSKLVQVDSAASPDALADAMRDAGFDVEPA